MKLLKSGSVLGVCLALASVAVAQPPGRGPGGGGPGGFGGRGGGAAQGVLAMLGMAELQKELALSEAQIGSLKSIGEKASEEARAAGGNFNREELQNLSEEERQKRFADMRAKAEEAGKKLEAQIHEVLNETQKKRLGELRLQREGITAITREDVAKQLKLTDDQLELVAGIQAEARKAMGQFGGRGPGGPGGGGRPQGGAGGQPGGGDFRAAMEAAQKAREKQLTDLLAVLTPEQKTAWEAMQGKKFEFPQRGPFGGGPGGGRGGAPGGAAPGENAPRGPRPPSE